jgi:hypothetical protein
MSETQERLLSQTKTATELSRNMRSVIKHATYGDAVHVYMKELKYFAREARTITGSPMAPHMHAAVRGLAAYFTRKKYPGFRR